MSKRNESPMIALPRRASERERERGKEGEREGERGREEAGLNNIEGLAEYGMAQEGEGNTSFSTEIARPRPA